VPMFLLNKPGKLLMNSFRCIHALLCCATYTFSHCAQLDKPYILWFMWVNKTLQTIAIKSMMINCYEQRCFGLLVTVTRKKNKILIKGWRQGNCRFL